MQATPAPKPTPVTFVNEQYRASVEQTLRVLQNPTQSCDMVGFLVPRTPWRIIIFRSIALQGRVGISSWPEADVAKTPGLFSWEAKLIDDAEGIYPDTGAGFATPQEAWNTALAMVGQRMVAPFMMLDQKG